MSTFTRRTFLVTLAGGGTAIAVVLLSGKDERTIVLELRDILERNEGTDYIGEWYLKKVPDESDIEVLSERIFSELSWDRFFETNVGLMLRRRVRRDFEEDKVLQFGFWRLSQTEARMCALIFLSGRAPTPSSRDRGKGAVKLS